MGRFTLAIVAVLSLSLSGCASLIAMKSNAADLWEWAKWSMSGVTLRQPQEYVRDAVQEAKDLQEDVGQRVENISEGVRKIQEGRDLIRRGLGTGTGSSGDMSDEL